MAGGTSHLASLRLILRPRSRKKTVLTTTTTCPDSGPSSINNQPSPRSRCSKRRHVRGARTESPLHHPQKQATLGSGACVVTGVSSALVHSTRCARPQRGLLIVFYGEK